MTSRILTLICITAVTSLPAAWAETGVAPPLEATAAAQAAKPDSHDTGQKDEYADSIDCYQEENRYQDLCRLAGEKTDPAATADTTSRVRAAAAVY
jgi:hypothetical protein